MPKTELPENFPGKKQLEAVGIESLEQVRDMSEEDLIALDGIGPKTAAEIRAQVDGPSEDERQKSSSGEPKKSSSDKGETQAQAAAKSVADKTGHTNVIR
jgi:ERCC4-type nuclease